MKHLQQHSVGSSRHHSQSVKQQWATHPKGKLAWWDIKHGAVAIPLIFTFPTDLAKHTLLLSRAWIAKLFNLLLDSLTKIISRSNEKQGNCKILPRYQHAHKTQQELKPLKAEVSRSSCSPCILQLLFKHTLAVCTHSYRTTQCATTKQHHCKPQHAAIFFCFSTKFNLLPISDTPDHDGLHSFTS